MEDPSQSMIFKILNGPQNGVEVALEDGDYSIGNDREDDLQITDVALSGRHGRLRIANGRISIAAGSGAISTSTGLILAAGEAAWHDIDQLDVVSLGSTRFAVGKASANWAGLLASSSVTMSAERSVRPERRAPAAPAVFLRYGLPAAALIVLATFGAIALSSPQGSITGLIKRDTASDAELVRAAITKLPFGREVKVTEEVDGSIFASGYVGSLVERRAVNDAVTATGVQVRMRLWARDVVRNEVAALIEVKQLPLTFDMTKDGQIVLKGRELDKAKVDELSALIGQQVVGVSGVKSEVETSENILETVRGLARKAKVGEGVLFRLAPLDNGGQLIEATGAIRNDQIDAWLGFLKSYAATIADIMALRSYVGIEGQTVVINNGAAPGSAQAATAGAPAAVPLILASDKSASGAVGRHVPLDMFLNNQTSYEKLLSAVTPAKASTPGAAAAAKTSRDGKQTDQALASPDADAAPVAVKPVAAKAEPIEKKPEAPKMAGPSLMQALGVSQAASVLAGDEDAAIVAPPMIMGKPPTQIGGNVRAKAETLPVSKTPSGEAAAAPLQASSSQPSASKPPLGSEVADAAPGAAPVTPRMESTPKTQEDASSGPPADKQVKSAAATEGDTALSAQSPTTQKAIRQLREAATAILKLNNSPRLQEMLGSERGRDVQRALDRISGDVKQAAALRPLAAERAIAESVNACWSGANVTPEILPTVLFWLDLLSISDNVSIDDLFIDNYGLLLEAGLSPDRVRECLLKQSDPTIARLADSSIYLEEVGRNPDFIRFLLRSSPAYNLVLAGANTSGSRYIQLDNGDTLTEGAAPSLDSRIASIGDLGVLVRVPNGYVAEVYPKSMPWMIR